MRAKRKTENTTVRDFPTPEAYEHGFEPHPEEAPRAQRLRAYAAGRRQTPDSNFAKQRIAQEDANLGGVLVGAGGLTLLLGRCCFPSQQPLFSGSRRKPPHRYTYGDAPGRSIGDRDLHNQHQAGPSQSHEEAVLDVLEAVGNPSKCEAALGILAKAWEGVDRESRQPVANVLLDLIRALLPPDQTPRSAEAFLSSLALSGIGASMKRA